MFMKNFTRSIPAISVVEPRMTFTMPQPVTHGLVAGTLVKATQGWVAVERLKIGDAVQTLDGGLARIHVLDRRMLTPQTDMALIVVPGGCHGANSDLRLVPGQHLLIDTLDDERCNGARFALVPAAALTIDPLVRRHNPQTPVQVVTLMFAVEEVVLANSGVMIHCPGLIDGAGRYPEHSYFPRLDILAARKFLRHRATRHAV